MYSSFEDIGIIGISTTVPSSIVDNSSFIHILSDKEIRKFEKTVGIKERRWASSGVTSSDLGQQAANRLIEQLGVNRSDIGAVLFLSQTPDFIIPFSSNILQDKLNIPQNSLCLDINAGCAGFIQGLFNAFSIVNTLPKGKMVLLVVAETLSKILSMKDKSTSMLFGDGAAAILVVKLDVSSTTYFNFFSDGSHYQSIMIPDGGFRNSVSFKSFETKVDDKNNEKTALKLHMNGQAVFDFTLREVAVGIKNLVEDISMQLSAIDYFILHQSNHYIIKQIAAQLNVSEEKMLTNIQFYGNTSGVSIPLAISDFNKELSQSSTIMLSGYGSGLNWGNCIINLSKTNILPITSV